MPGRNRLIKKGRVLPGQSNISQICSAHGPLMMRRAYIDDQSWSGCALGLVVLKYGDVLSNKTRKCKRRLGGRL